MANNVYQSQYAKIAIRALNTDSASYALTASYAMNGGGSGSTNTGSLLTTASAAGNTITFTKGDGSTFPVTVAGGTGAPGGSDTQLQFNSASVFSGSSKLTYNYTSSILTLTGSMIVSGAISASFGPNTVGFYGTASWAINALTASFITASNVWGPFGSSSVASASFASSSVSASYAETASAAPSDTYIQYNNNGILGAEQYFRYIYASHSLQQGDSVTASGNYSHAEGRLNYASASWSHVGGLQNTSSGIYQTVVGQNSAQLLSQSAFIVGGGRSTNVKNNALVVIPKTTAGAFPSDSILEVLVDTASISASYLYLNNLPTSPQLNVLIYNSESNQVFYTASNAIGGGGSGGGGISFPYTITSSAVAPIFFVSGGYYFEIAQTSSGERLFKMKYENNGVLVEMGGLTADDTTFKVDQINQTITINAQTASILNLTEVTQTNIVTVDTVTGQLFYTASSAIGGGGSNTPAFPYTGSAVITGSLVITGSTISTLGFTGSLFGTASYVSGSIFTSTNPALSASYALTSSTVFVTNEPFPSTPVVRYLTYVYATASNQSLITTGSLAYNHQTNTIFATASQALTASFALNAGGTFNSTSSIIGNGLSSSFNINHGFNTRNLHITVYESGSNGETVYPDLRRINANTASIIFANPPTTNQYIVYISQ